MTKFRKNPSNLLFNLIRLKQRNSHKIRPEFSAPITLHQKGCQPTRSHRRAVEYKLSTPRGYNSNKYIFEEKFHFSIIIYRFQKREHSSISEISEFTNREKTGRRGLEFLLRMRVPLSAGVVTTSRRAIRPF